MKALIVVWYRLVAVMRVIVAAVLRTVCYPNAFPTYQFRQDFPVTLTSAWSKLVVFLMNLEVPMKIHCIMV